MGDQNQAFSCRRKHFLRGRSKPGNLLWFSLLGLGIIVLVGVGKKKKKKTTQKEGGGSEKPTRTIGNRPRQREKTPEGGKCHEREKKKALPRNESVEQNILKKSVSTREKLSKHGQEKNSTE